MSEDVLGYLRSKGLDLRSAPGDEIRTPCFFCGENPQSRGRLYINTDPNADIPGLFHCKICGEKGALRSLMRHFGDHSDEPDSGSDEWEMRRRIMNAATKFYFDNLQEHPDVIAWLKGPERNLTIETIAKAQIGYASGNRTLYEHLKAEGYKPRDILATGLVIEYEGGGKLVDSLSGMVTIPYTIGGNTVSVRGRAWPYGGQGMKYKTPAGHKARLYNVDACYGDEAEQHLIVTEGEFDALVLGQMGFPAIAVPGAGTWQDRWDSYVASTKRLFTVFDRDPAGEQGTQKLRERFPGKVRPIHLSEPGSKVDPTTWSLTHGPEQFGQILEAAGKSGLLVTVADARLEHAELQGLSGLKLGEENFDLVIAPGLLGGQVMIMLAKTGTGKTITCLNLMQRMRMVEGQENLRFLFISLEQTRGEWWERARRIHRFYNLDATDDECAAWWEDRIFLVDKNRVTEDELRAAVDDFEAATGELPDGIMIDYLGYWANGFKGERYERTSDAVMAMKAVAKDLRAPIFAPHQVNRSVKDGEQFGTDAARDSGAVEETADFLTSIWKEDNRAGTTSGEQSGIVKMKLLKSRHGGVGTTVEWQFAPLSLAMVPHNAREDELVEMARLEREWFAKYRTTWDEAVYRHREGITDGALSF